MNENVPKRVAGDRLANQPAQCVSDEAVLSLRGRARPTTRQHVEVSHPIKQPLNEVKRLSGTARSGLLSTVGFVFCIH
jgi:hypothetical protein